MRAENRLRRVSIRLACFALLSLAVYGFGQSQQKADENSWSRKLHVIVLECGTKDAQPFEGPFEVVHLPGAELPEILSHALLPSSGGTLTMPADAGIPNRSTLLDIFTFSLSEEDMWPPIILPISWWVHSFCP